MATDSTETGWERLFPDNTYVSAKHNGIEGIRITKSVDGCDVRLLGDTPASYYVDWDASGPTLTFPSGVTLAVAGTLNVTGTFTSTDKLDSDDYTADSVDKEHLAAEVYSIEHICVHISDPDNETMGLTRVWSACTVVRCSFWTSGAIGAGFGIDVLDAGTTGTGTSVINSCSDNLNGFDSNDLTTPHALSANDYVSLKFDNLATAPANCIVDIMLKVPLGTAT